MEGVRKMNKAIRMLKDHIKKDINLDQIEILLHLADNEPEPLSYSALSHLMDNPMANISRNIKILGESYINNQANEESLNTGIGLVKTFPSTNDSEEYVAFLTDEGIKVVWVLNELIK